jgi:HlyD family secretion protein
VTPKIELSDARTEQVDLRVLPVVFRFKPPTGAAIYSGQQVDVYIGSR